MVITPFNWTSTFEWYMTRFVIENGQQKGKCYDEIWICVHDVSTIINSIVNFGTWAY